jgi:hypothetical protein
MFRLLSPEIPWPDLSTERDHGACLLQWTRLSETRIRLEGPNIGAQNDTASRTPVLISSCKTDTQFTKSRRDGTTNDSQPRSVRRRPWDRLPALPACQQALSTGGPTHGVIQKSAHLAGYVAMSLLLWSASLVRARGQCTETRLPDRHGPSTRLRLRPQILL